MVRQLVAIMIATVFGLSIAAPAFAHHESWHDGGPPGERIQSRFDDWASGFWANESLARMITKGVIKGNGDGTIAPSRAVTRLEAAIMLSRLLHLEEPALFYGELELEAPWGELKIENKPGKFEIKIESRGEGEFKFEDSNAVPSWGRGAILTALQEGFLIFDGASLSPMAPLNRLEAAIMLVKAAKLDAEAVARAGADLPFTDAARIPDRLKGYIAVAIENGFVNGYDDGSFRPQRLVTRAEWAALLDRLDRKGPTVSPDGRQVKGTVTAVNIGAAPGISMTTPVFPGGVTYPVDDTALFYSGGKEMTIADVAVGDQVIINLSTDRKILMVTIHNVPRQVSGTVTAYSAPTATGTGSLTLAAGTGSASTYAIPAGVAVSLNGGSATAADIRVGDQVTLSLEGASVKRIAIKAEPRNVTGTLVTVTAGAGGSLPSVTVRMADNSLASYTVADHATLGTSGGAGLTLADLKAGDTVILKVERSMVVRITVTASVQVSAVSGTVSAYTAPSGSAAGILALTTASGTGSSYAVTAAAAVTLGSGTATLADIRVGDQVTLHLENEQVKAIAIQIQSIRVSGTLASVIPGSNGAPATLAVSGQNDAVAIYYVAPQAAMATSGGTQLTLADLRVGDSVTLTVERNQVVQIIVS